MMSMAPMDAKNHPERAVAPRFGPDGEPLEWGRPRGF